MKSSILYCTGAYFVDGVAVACTDPECCVERARREERLAAQHFPRLGMSRYARLILSGKLEDRPVLTVARAWAASTDCPFLILMGPVGSGKTIAATLALCLSTYEVAYLSAARLHALRHDDLLTLATQRGLLLDDLGLENPSSEAAAVNLFHLINTRYLDDLRTVITTNLTRAALQSRYDDRILRRLAEAAYWHDAYTSPNP